MYKHEIDAKERENLTAGIRWLDSIHHDCIRT